MRENVPPSTPAVVLIVSVFASPGTPSISRCPCASRHTSTRSSIASCPAMTRLISKSACSRRSFAAAGEATGGASGCSVTSALLLWWLELYTKARRLKFPVKSACRPTAVSLGDDWGQALGARAAGAHLAHEQSQCPRPLARACLRDARGRERVREAGRPCPGARRDAEAADRPRGALHPWRARSRLGLDRVEDARTARPHRPDRRLHGRLRRPSLRPLQHPAHGRRCRRPRGARSRQASAARVSARIAARRRAHRSRPWDGSCVLRLSASYFEGTPSDSV